jgi:type III pantothenate kinase
MILLIDAGNTLIKWAVIDQAKWLRYGSLPVGQASELAKHLATELDAIDKGRRAVRAVWLSNVAGEGVGLHIRKLCDDRSLELHQVAAQDTQCGVHNCYAIPGELGSDRWAALIGAWQLIKGECLVVNCGTATTIDALSPQGEFKGGLILPGVDLMLKSLRETTALLVRAGHDTRSSAYPRARVTFPTTTSDAMFSGAIQATCGAVRGQHSLLVDESAPVVLSGGAADVLQKDLLHVPLYIVENLVLQGMLMIALEAGEV